jgi:hypothetical protein
MEEKMKVERSTDKAFKSASAPHTGSSPRFNYPGITALLFGLLLVYGCGGGPHTAVLNVPSNPQPLCTVPPPVFTSWFQADSVTLNGVVNPAASDSFPNSGNCSFYEWAEHMYLWLTSPAPTVYGNGAHVFDSGIFYDVSSPDAAGNRTLIPHTPGLIRVMGLRAAQVGPDNLPVIINKAGKMMEIEPPKFAPDGKQLILNSSGKMVEIERAVLGEKGVPTFFDKNGNAIKGARAVIPLESNRLKMEHPVPKIQKFIIGKLPIFLDGSGNVVEVEVGQAGGGGVLVAQNGSLVYYATMVNDVYAYYLTGLKDGSIPAPGGVPDNAFFPTSLSTLSPITAFASAHGKTLPDSNALAVEVKTSWVEASGLSNPGDYITETATIPTYDTSNSNKWIPNGQKTVTLALVGIHVVGSAVGHPEMIWATFEHEGNTPNAGYGYASTSGDSTVSRNTAGDWLFCANGSSGPFNELHAFANGDTIVSDGPFTISPSNTIRWKPWGSGSETSPNPLVNSVDSSNSEIIAINNSVRGMLVSGDVRGNYIMSGATWTIGGQSPTGNFPIGNEVGTSKLANTTMETYQQGTDSLSTSGTNCFDCHASNKVDVSHMFDPLKPLF